MYVCMEIYSPKKEKKIEEYKLGKNCGKLLTLTKRNNKHRMQNCQHCIIIYLGCRYLWGFHNWWQGEGTRDWVVQRGSPTFQEQKYE